mmetsp:Transcript_823/g.1742  ORF Transcript_823/g.1742 Transcript_823/m.1742 type:complete len:210 (-) Transcript_823:1181-1810(-)
MRAFLDNSVVCVSRWRELQGVYAGRFPIGRFPIVFPNFSRCGPIGVVVVLLTARRCDDANQFVLQGVLVEGGVFVPRRGGAEAVEFHVVRRVEIELRIADFRYHARQPVALLDLLENVFVLLGDKKEVLAHLFGLGDVAGGLPDLPDEDGAVIEQDFERAAAARRVEARLVVVPEANHGDFDFAAHVHHDYVRFPRVEGAQPDVEVVPR